MGCVHSQPDENGTKDKSKSGENATSNGGGGGGATNASNAVLDPRLPLNARQKYSMMASWKGINRALEPTGVYMFMKLFEEHGELLGLFSKFHALTTRDAQASSAELAEHAVNVMNTVDESLRSLDNMDSFIAYLHQIGQSHCKVPGFHKEYFWKIRGPFLEAVKMTLGDRYTENIEAIYQISVNLIIQTLIEGYEKAAPQQQAVQQQSSAPGTSSTTTSS